MRNLITATALTLTLVGSAQAGTAREVFPDEVRETCSNVRSLAEQVFDARYLGVPREVALSLVATGDADMDEYFQAVVNFVYAHHKAESAEMQQHARNLTTNTVYQICHDGIGDWAVR